MISTVRAIRTFLLSKAAITALVGTRIYGMPGIPSGVVANMPQKVITIYRSPGRGGLTIPVYEENFQIRCYGETPAEADVLWRALYDSLHRVISAQVTVGADEICIYTAHVRSGGTDAIELATKWPFVLSGWGICFTEGPLP